MATDVERELYTQLVSGFPEVKLKGAKIPYTSLNGNMFSYVGENGLALRLPASEREAFIKKYATSLYKTYGINQKEYVKVPDDLLRQMSELKPYFQKSFEFARTLKPKPTKKKT